MARFNPMFNDAHVGLLIPARPQEHADAVAITIQPMPDALEVYSTADPSRQFGRVHSLNSMPWEDYLVRALPLIRGENDALRKGILGLRFAELAPFILPKGELRSITIKTEEGAILEMPVASERLNFVPLAPSDFGLSIDQGIATLTIPTFERAREEELGGFLKSAFARIADEGAESLVIDLRANGGGAHELSDRLMAYLTDRPFVATSAITARITPENQALVPQASLGDVLTLPFAEEVIPQTELPDRFRGDVTILLGPQTYSQAIVFAATAQDTGIARLTGQAHRAPANQTGQVQTHTLANTGFTVRAPIYIIYRGSGDRSRDPLKINANSTP
ncbi:MAG: S41 family peptidase [Pseudomonadota bacterium]